MLASVEFVPRFKNGLVVGYRAAYRSRQGQIYNDAQAVLQYLVKNPQEYHNAKQSYRKISEATGIPPTTLKRIIKWHLSNGGESCVLHTVAFRAGILIKYVGKPGRIMFARYATSDEQWALRGSGDGGQLYVE